jgi:uncharacterized protein YegL
MSSIPDSWIPEQYLDDITSELMTDPVVDPTTGQTYDRKSIERWIRDKGISPGSRQPLTIAQLKPNVKLAEGLASMMARFARGYTGPGASIAPPAASSNSSTSSESKVSPMAVPFADAPIGVEAETYTIDGQQYLTVTCTAPETGAVQEADYYFLYDISGSMGSTIAVDMEVNGKTTQVYLSRDYLVQSAIRAAIALLEGRGRVCIITYNSSARVLFPLQSVDAGCLERVSNEMKKIVPTDGTNMFAAVDLANKLIEAQSADRRAVVLLLTDGVPTRDYTPRGLVETIQKDIKHKKPYTLHTMGFGNELNTETMVNIARWGGGRFLHAPSKEMVGTVIINFVASELTVANKGLPITYSSIIEPVTLNTGPIGFGQPTYVTVPVPAVPTHLSVNGTDIPISTASPSSFLKNRQLLLLALDNVLKTYRASVSSRRLILIATLQQPLTILEDLLSGSEDVKVRDMLEDVRGELMVSTQYMDTWGQPYVNAYSEAVRAGIPFNFKDKGLLLYVGPLMNQLLDEADSIYRHLEPIPIPMSYSSSNSSSAPAPTITSSAYQAALYDAGGSCFAAATPITVLLDDGTAAIREIQDVRRGDRVITINGIAEVLFSIKFGTKSALTSMTKLSDHLSITPYHPVRFQNGGWKNPIDLAGHQPEPLNAVYNLVLLEYHNVLVDGIECITLAHGLEEEGVKHPFFGTVECIESLRGCPGFHEGRPVFENCVAVKDPNTGLVVGWREAL